MAINLKLPLIIDERKGRQVTKQLDIEVTGFAALLIQATWSNILSKEDAVALLYKTLENGLRLSEALQLQVRAKLLN